MVCLEGELYPLIYTNPWSVWYRYFWKPPWTDYAWWHATACRRWARMVVVLGLDMLIGWASLFICLAHFCIMLLELQRLLGFPLVFECVSYKTCFLQYKWNWVNSKGIYVKSLFISPVLHFNWWSDLIVSDHQQKSSLATLINSKLERSLPNK
jgi:hypothetical protein